MALTPAGRGAGRVWPAAGPAMLAAGAAFVLLRLVTPSTAPADLGLDRRRGAGPGAPNSTLRDRDLVTAIDGVALGIDGGWRAPAQRPGDRLAYQVVRDGQHRAVPITLRAAEVPTGCCGRGERSCSWWRSSSPVGRQQLKVGR